MLEKQQQQNTQLTAELAGKASRSDVDDEFKALQVVCRSCVLGQSTPNEPSKQKNTLARAQTYDRKRTYVENVSVDVRAMLASGKEASKRRQ